MVAAADLGLAHLRAYSVARAIVSRSLDYINTRPVVLPDESPLEQLEGLTALKRWAHQHAGKNCDCGDVCYGRFRCPRCTLETCEICERQLGRDGECASCTASLIAEMREDAEYEAADRAYDWARESAR